jgi:hypothetical protein
MRLKSCRVVVSDMDGNEHTVEVSASTLYEAVALGLSSIRSSDWTGEIPEGLNAVRVLVRDVPVEHKVQIGHFKNWLSREGGAPNEIMARRRVQDILRR